MNYPPNNFSTFYNETPNQYMGHENFMPNNYQPIPSVPLKIEKPISFQESMHGSHHNSHSSQKIKLNPMDFSYLQTEENIKIEQPKDRKEKHREHHKQQQHRDHKEHKEQKVQRSQQKAQKDLKELQREQREREQKEKELREFKELKELQEQKEKELKELKERKEQKELQDEKEYAYLKGQKDHKTSHSKHPNSSHKDKKVAKSRSKKNVEKKIHLSSHEGQSIKPMMQQPNSNFERSEKREPSLLSKGMSFSGNPGINKGEPLPPYPHQQYFSIVPLEKDMQQQNNRRSVQIPQIYQAQPSYRPNSNYFYGPPQENNYINNNVISNNFCFQTGNPNHFVGVNYPNVQNITFTKPNGYPPAAYGVMELNNNDNYNNQYAINNMNDNRSYGDKHRNADYWKSNYYSYNSQN